MVLHKSQTQLPAYSENWSYGPLDLSGDVVFNYFYVSVYVCVEKHVFCNCFYPIWATVVVAVCVFWKHISCNCFLPYLDYCLCVVFLRILLIFCKESLLLWLGRASPCYKLHRATRARVKVRVRVRVRIPFHFQQYEQSWKMSLPQSKT